MSSLDFDDLFREALEEDGESVSQKAGYGNDDNSQSEADSQQQNEPAESSNADKNTSADNTNVNSDNDSVNSDTPETDGEVDYKELYEKEKHRTESWHGRLKARDKENETLRAQLQALDAQLKSAANSKSEKDVAEADESVATFLSEFPELADPIRKMIDNAVKGTRHEIRAEVERDVTPLKQSLQETVKERHFNAITQAHSDFEDIVTSGQLKEWIDKQPSFVRRAYEEVYERGTTSEVIDLLDVFRAASPRVAREDTNEVATSPNSQVAKHKPAQAVRSRHGGIPAVRKQVAKDDFEGAWEAAMASE